MTALVFAPAVQALLDAGNYVLVKDAAGFVLPIARDVASGRFAAVGRLVESVHPFIGFNPIIAPAQIATNIIMGTGQMIQTHRGFQKTYSMLDTLQTNVGVLQASTALIGVGTVAGVALSAVNLYQTFKIRQDIKQLKIEVKDGFIDLKKALATSNEEILQRIDRVADDVEFRQHRTILAQAYGRFLQALVYIKDALKVSDTSLRNMGISNAQKMLYDALADYNNPLLLHDTSVAGQIRIKECSWAIEQAITLTYQLQGSHEAIGDRIAKQQRQIRQETIHFLDSCQSQEELDFLSPEVLRLNNQDIIALEYWKTNLEFTASLSPAETQELAQIEVETLENFPEEAPIFDPVPEQNLYEDLKQKSHFQSLRDQMKFLIDPAQRQPYEEYITQQALNSEYKALAPANWQEVPDFTVANLYWYFKNRAS
jgi:hypothetical protein